MSLFSVSRIKTIEAANNALESVKEHRAELFEKKVAAYMVERKYFFGLIKCKPMSREEAEKTVKENADWTEDWVCRGWGDEATAKTLLKACNASEEANVFLSAEDSAFVEKFS